MMTSGAWRAGPTPGSRSPHRDRRSTLIGLTGPGRALDRAMEVHTAEEQALLAGLSDAERRRLAELLRKLLLSVDAELTRQRSVCWTDGLGCTLTTRSLSSPAPLKPCGVCAGTTTMFPAGTVSCSSPAVNRAVPVSTTKTSG